jgi:hypothetical protein
VWDITNTGGSSRFFRIVPSVVKNNWGTIDNIDISKANGTNLTARSRKFDTVGVNSGTYTFSLQYSDDNMSTWKNSINGPTTLKVVDSSIKEI